MKRLVFAVCFLCSAGCSLVVTPDEAMLGPDTGTSDTGARDTGARDTGTRDTGTRDTGTADTIAPDTGPPPACTIDSDCPPRGGSTARCVEGACNYECVDGFADCDGSSDNGCETDLSTPMNCGRCGMECTLDNTIASCDGGECRVGDCFVGFADCDGNNENGCEADLRETANCGRCGVRCAAGEVCAGDVCRSTCDAPNLMCGGLCVDPATDPSHCGRCGSTCEFPNAAAECRDGACEIVDCLPGYADCDGNTDNGCEAPLDTLANCGACGDVCSRRNATASCDSGSCSIGMCDASYGNCDGRDENGCETDVRATLDHCGACGSACAEEANAGGVCRTSSCEYECDARYGDCDDTLGDGTNGCEVLLASDRLHCGGCGIECPGDCVGGECAPVACPPGTCAEGGGCVDLDPADMACSSAPRLMFIPGDDSGDIRTETRFGPGLFRIQISETSRRDRNLSVTAELTGPSDMDYDLQGWCENCGNQSDAVTSRGPRSDESVTLRWEDDEDNIDTMDVWFRVVLYDGRANNCAPWTLTIEGDTSRRGSPTCASPDD